MQNAKLINKKSIIITTVIIYLIAILTFELLYCNTQEKGIHYDFSLCRTVIYIVFFAIYFLGKNKWVEEAIKVSKNKYKRIFIYLAVIVSILSVLITIGAIIVGIDSSAMIRAIGITLISILMGTIFILYVSNDAIKNMVVIVLTFGIVFSITTNFNHALDEKRHFMSAFNIANFNLDYVKNPITDKQIERLPQLSKFTIIDDFLKQGYKAEITNEVNMEDIPSIPAEYNFITYLFPAVGILIAKILGGSIIDMYILGRIMNVILYGILICIAIKIIPFKKNIFAVIFSFPMLLLLAASYSVDGFCVGIISIFIAYCLNLYKNSQTISLKQFILLIILFGLTLFAKSGAYIFVGIILFMLPIIKTLKKNKKYLPIICTGIVIALILLMIFLIFIKNSIGADARGGNTNASQQMQILINNPIHDIKLAINQTLETLFNFNWYSMLHQNVFFTNKSIYVMFVMMLFLLYISITEDDYNFKIKDKIIMIISFLAVFATTSVGLYLSFTEIGQLHVAGYQPRYIFPILPLVLFTLSSNKLKVQKNENRVMNTSIISGIFLIIGLAQLIVV